MKGQVKGWVALPALGYGMAATLDGRWLLVAVPEKNVVAVVDTKSLKVVRSIEVAASPQVVLMRPDGKVAYVACMDAGKVAAIDLAGWKVEKLITVGKGDDGMAWAK